MMTKEILEDLLVEFDEMGYEPTTLCDNEREVESFRNRLKQVLDYLKSIDKKRCGANVEKVIIDEFVPSKELEALKQVNELINNVEEYKNKTGKDNPTICLSEKLLISIQNALQPALQRLEAIDNANPSEALSAFRSVELTLKENRLLNDGGWLIDDINTIKQALIKAQEQDKVLEVIKELISKYCKIELIDGGTYYQIKIKVMGSDYTFGMSITEEEFDLLKKILE